MRKYKKRRLLQTKVQKEDKIYKQRKNINSCSLKLKRWAEEGWLSINTNLEVMGDPYEKDIVT